MGDAMDAKTLPCYDLLSRLLFVHESVSLQQEDFEGGALKSHTKIFQRILYIS